MNVIYFLWLREMRRYVRSRVQIAAALGQPLLYLLALGFGMGPVFRSAGRGSYLQFVAPGVIAMTLLFTSVFSGIGILWDRQFGFLRETLVAPVPRVRVLIGRTLGGATVAVLQGLLVVGVSLIAGFRAAHVSMIPLVLLLMALVAFVFAALGSAIGSVLQDMQGFQLVMNFVVMPLFFLSGALFPLSGLPPVMAVVTRLDPLAYGVDGLRGTLIGATQFGVLLDILVLVTTAAVCLAVGRYLFSRIEV